MAGNGDFSALSALRRFAREESEKKDPAQDVSEERCDLCGAFIPPDPDHRHLMEVATREISCVCRPCSILFDSKAASEGRYRVIPDRLLHLEDFEMSDARWEGLRVPVDMAFFFYNTPAGKVVAYYPSPMGPTESLLELETWEELEADNPVLKDMERDVEALLVNRARGADEHFLVPMDECYKLVGLIRTRWRGFSGGREVWDEISAFFDGLKGRSRRVSREGT
jgi:hypothetical protein